MENLIHLTQLKKEIEGVSLKDVISNNFLGNIKRVAENLYLWKLDREILKKAKGIVYDFLV
ncbi:hypothetical protein F0L74_13250 [Chitinophaga agrisoli]|uniref:Uncharacterized protein n=1 Tax=Chitinophaga agrisoli TaxID=2607653 RepID=A0A5B2VYZ8_9BACT|nr:hypothetical protein [Chitinophaga agrisoli]KAA2243456.1 hypothetical protein F0L74_13250 [Chitinophaga agrisoli]